MNNVHISKCQDPAVIAAAQELIARYDLIVRKGRKGSELGPISEATRQVLIPPPPRDGDEFLPHPDKVIGSGVSVGDGVGIVRSGSGFVGVTSPGAVTNQQLQAVQQVQAQAAVAAAAAAAAAAGVPVSVPVQAHQVSHAQFAAHFGQGDQS